MLLSRFVTYLYTAYSIYVRLLIFISHGSPDIALNSSPARDFLIELGQQIEKPKAILVISAHWDTHYPTINAGMQPPTIHDFSGFPQKLYDLRYPAPGDPQLALYTKNLLARHGFKTELAIDRGFDHGAWIPLMLMYPHADIPVIELSIQSGQNPAYHFALGEAISPLKAEGVLILGSGAATHNPWEIGKYDRPPDWVIEFSDWLTAKVTSGDLSALLNYERIAPYAQRNHPTPEHLLPLFAAMGASGKDIKAVQLHSSYTYGVLSMAAFGFYADAPAKIEEKF